jgi:hypothetical protein
MMGDRDQQANAPGEVSGAEDGDELGDGGSEDATTSHPAEAGSREGTAINPAEAGSDERTGSREQTGSHERTAGGPAEGGSHDTPLDQRATRPEPLEQTFGAGAHPSERTASDPAADPGPPAPPRSRTNDDPQ